MKGLNKFSNIFSSKLEGREGKILCSGIYLFFFFFSNKNE